MDCVASEGTACKKRRVGVDGVSGVTSGVSGKEVPSCGSKSESSSDSDECAEELQFIGGVDSNVEDSDDERSRCDGQEEIEANFELYDPKEEDFEGLALLLKHSRVFRHFLQPADFRRVAEVVAQQGNIGSVFKANGEAMSAFGFLSLINPRQYPEALGPIVEKILHLAGSHAREKSRDRFVSLLSKNSDCKDQVGILIGSRFANLPLEVTVAAAESLKEDIQWSMSTPEMNEDERLYYDFKYVVGITLVYKDKGKGDVASDALGIGFNPTYLEFEHEVYSSDSLASFVVPTNQNVKVLDSVTLQA